MKAELERLIAAERKNKRALIELRAFRQKVMEHKNPDQKVLKLIDDEIATLTGEK